MMMRRKYGNIIGYTEELFHTFDMLAEQKHHELIFTSNETKWKTYFDQDKWHKIVFNLLSNAIKYTNPNGKIELEINKTIYNEQETVYLKIKDNGMGMRSEHVAQIFNRFYQIDGSATRFQEGAGIGLSLVKELVELQNGTIEVQSTIGKGTTFEIKIPVPKNVIEASNLNPVEFLPVELVALANTKTKLTNTKEQLQVLIIEDNADMRDYISSCLDNTKYSVSMASNGEEGVQKAIETIPDIIISDVMMPKKDGFEVVTELRQHLPTSHIPIVLLTAKAALDSRLEGLKRGADAYLTKPFSAKELIIRVHKLIELRQSIQQCYQSVATLHSDISSSEPTVHNDIQYVEDEFVMNIRLYIEERLEDSSLSVEQIGEYFHMSRTQLYRKFKALTDTSISSFIKTLRMKKALTLLKEQKNTMSEVAYACGFSSPSHFSKMFKSVYGKSPSEMI
jgi:DNA-binding response OmpR family regulator